MKTFIKTAAIFLVLMILPVSAGARTLIPGGQLLGMALEDDTVTVAKLDDALSAGRKAGLREGDRITHIDGTPVTDAQQVRKCLDRSAGQVELRLSRGEQTLNLTVTPDITPEGPRLGIYLKEGITGVGTVTWYDPESGRFGALGHCVNDAAGGMLSLHRGAVYSARVLSVKKGKSGNPGQLVGALDPNSQTGSLEKNTPQGVFGQLNQPLTGKAMEVAEKNEIQVGDATILSTVGEKGSQEYSVKILKIYPNSREQGRNMLIKVTDPALLEATGGIVQGMSGSPIIQDGKLVGAVTHVLVNDPTTGYGIFIENMLDAAA